MEFPAPVPVEREPVAPGDQRVEKGIHDEGRRVGRVTVQKVSGQCADRDAAVSTAGKLGATVLGESQNRFTKLADLQDPQGARFTVSQFLGVRS